MLDNGLVQRIVKKWSQKPSKRTETTDDLILGLAQVRTPFTILFAGVVCALIVMLSEKIYCYWIHRGAEPQLLKSVSITSNAAGQQINRNLDHEDVDYWRQRAIEAEKKLDSYLSNLSDNTYCQANTKF